jgi:hypothetical protein
MMESSGEKRKVRGAIKKQAGSEAIYPGKRNNEVPLSP